MKSASPHRPNTLLNMDGRSAEARLLRRVRADLIRHVGGSPTATQTQLIEQAAWLRLHITKLNARALAEGGFSDYASRQYLAWSNSLERISRHLGLVGAPQRPKTLAEIMADERGVA